MQYIIMCGGASAFWQTPKQLTEVNGEPLVARTIRLLKEQGVKDIYISSNNDAFEQFGVPVLRHTNNHYVRSATDCDGLWVDAFYPTNKPTCYVFGDVYFSPEAIKTIVETDTDDVMLFGSKKPFAPEYPKPYVEPFAYKVVNIAHFRQAIREVRLLDAQGVYKRKPIAWELWSAIKGAKPNTQNREYVAVNDYTCDIDTPEEIEKVLRGAR